LQSVPKIREIHWVKAFAREVYKCGDTDIATAPAHWDLTEPHPWLLLVPDIEGVQTAFAYSRTSKTWFPEDLQSVRIQHKAHEHQFCCINLRGVVQHAPEERVEVVISEFLDLVKEKSKVGKKRREPFTCNNESSSFLNELLLRLKTQFRQEYLFRKRKNEY
jgi:hypothetical protein